MDGKQLAKRVLIFSCEAALLLLLADVLFDRHRIAAGLIRHSPNTVFSIFFLAVGYTAAAVGNLLIPFLIRFLYPGKPLEGATAVLVSLINYATIMLLMALPYRLPLGNLGGGEVYYTLSCLAKMGGAVMILLAANVVLRMPEAGEPTAIDVPLTDAEKCLSALGDFIEVVKAQLGRHEVQDRLWGPVYSYLNNEMTVRNIVLTKHIAPDELMLNAVGSLSYRLLAGGSYHASLGVLNPQGEYLWGVWYLAANELVRRGYGSAQDMQRGVEALTAAVLSAGGTG